jgi:ribosome-binding factor A
MNTNPYRDQATEGIIKELAMTFLGRESNRTSLLTVTNVILSDRGKHVKILFTVLPEDKEKQALEFVKRQRTDFRDYLKKNARLPIIPFVEFDIDFGEKNRQTVDRLI